jgi:hypothetical protein
VVDLAGGSRKPPRVLPRKSRTDEADLLTSEGPKDIAC